jgi:hypothetical protein
MRSNALISGPLEAIDAFLDAARAELREPLLIVPCGHRFWLTPAGTVVLQNIHLLDGDGQASLVSWMNDSTNVRTQILSTTSVPLLNGVRGGVFDSALYYRLNTLYFTVQLPAT